MHLYSNALTYSSGDGKEYLATQSSKANNFIIKIAEASKKNPDIEKQVREWKNSNNLIVKKGYEAIKLYQQDTSNVLSEYYPLETLKKISGSLIFLGFSPNNDSHIFKPIKENQKITSIDYYFFSEKEAKIISEYFDNKSVRLLNVVEYWDSMI